MAYSSSLSWLYSSLFSGTSRRCDGVNYATVSEAHAAYDLAIIQYISPPMAVEEQVTPSRRHRISLPIAMAVQEQNTSTRGHHISPFPIPYDQKDYPTSILPTLPQPSRSPRLSIITLHHSNRSITSITPPSYHSAEDSPLQSSSPSTQSGLSHVFLASNGAADELSHPEPPPSYL